jgi:hypothetical protein
VEPYESHFCFHLRRNIRHFDTYTNSAHDEGTNNGLKASAARVLPQHSLDRSAAILNMNATINAKATASKSATNASTKCLWSNLPPGSKLTHKGESFVVAQLLL